MKHQNITSVSLFGDLEAAIDLMLDGDPEIKYEVAVADQNERGGYQALRPNNVSDDTIIPSQAA